MVAVCFCFRVSLPLKINKFRIFDIGKEKDYFDEEGFKNLVRRVSLDAFLPMNKLLLKLIEENAGKFRVSFSVSGFAMELIEKFAPNVFDQFVELSKTGCVEFVSESYYDSLSFLYSKEEFAKQVEMNDEFIEKHFGQRPKVFRHTKMILSNEIAGFVENLGYDGILVNGDERLLAWRSPNFLFESRGGRGKLALIPRNPEISDVFAKKFFDKNWDNYPLTSEKFARMIENEANNGDVVNVFVEYCEFAKKDVNICEMFEKLPSEILKGGHEFVTPLNSCDKFVKKDKLDVSYLLSEEEMSGVSYLIGNRMQEEALSEYYVMERDVKGFGDEKLLENWRKLGGVYNFHYMDTKKNLCENSNIYGGPYDAYIYFMNVLNDMIIRIKEDEMKSSGISNGSDDSLIEDVKVAVKGNI